MKLKALALAKITRPNYSKILLRKRLFSLLNKARKNAILWVSGPPGSGKTVLVSSYMKARSIPCVWYQMDSGDADVVATFFYYIGLSSSSALSKAISYVRRMSQY